MVSKTMLVFQSPALELGATFRSLLTDDHLDQLLCLDYTEVHQMRTVKAQPIEK